MEISTLEHLDLAIKELELKKIEKKNQLTEQFHEFHESIKPINIIKNGLHKLTAPGDLRSTLLRAAGGIGVGLLTKGLVSSKTAGSAFGSIVGKTLKVGVTSAVYNNADKLKAYGLAIFHNLFNKSKKPNSLKS